MVRVGIVVLAAGGSQRLGRPKQLLEIGNEPLVRRIARLAVSASASSVSVVLGACVEQCRKVLQDLPATILFNPDWETGIASSIRVGVAQAEAFQSDGVLVTTVDQIALSTDVLDQLIRLFKGEADAVIAAKYSGVIGNPILFGSQWFEPLQLLTGDVGARVLARSARKIKFVDWPDGSLDIDRPEDLCRIAQFC
jgi:molybdenum cofactor cytidylyltransferase